MNTWASKWTCVAAFWTLGVRSKIGVLSRSFQAQAEHSVTSKDNFNSLEKT